MDLGSRGSGEEVAVEPIGARVDVDCSRRRFGAESMQLQGRSSMGQAVHAV
jgi:hypothetical protein